MNTLDNLTQLCLKFKEKKYDLEEFQSRLESMLIPNELTGELEKVRFDATNRLEEIRFCSLEENFYKYGVEVADNILKVISELKR